MEEHKHPRFDDYMSKLLEERKKEVIKHDVINEFNLRKGLGLTSPTSASSTEENRLLMEYMNRSNILKISKQNKERGKVLSYMRFFRAKRNQQVEVYSLIGNSSTYTEGKVSAIGRDFVMLTNLRDRVWIPYKAIVSANIPYGIPNYSNSHQHFIYDNDFQHKLVYKFGETVSKRDQLKQQFFEESLQTNLASWEGTWVEIWIENERKQIGKIVQSTKEGLTIKAAKSTEIIPFKQISYIQSIRWFTIFKQSIKPYVYFLKK